VRFCVMCKTLTKRDEGCIHITCPVCDYEWCWNCGREYKSKHSCPRYWSPTAPTSNNEFLLTDLYKKTWNKGSFVTKVSFAFGFLLFSPFLIIGLLLFWPLFIENEMSNELSFKHPVKSFCTIITCLIFGILTLPITIFYILCLICFSVGIVFPVFAIYVIFQLIRGKSVFYASPQKKEKKRWKVGDIKTFIFKTTQSRILADNFTINIEEPSDMP